MALARRIRAANEAALGATSTLVLRALDREAEIHRRWARLDDAVACWKRIVAAEVYTPETSHAVQELITHYVYVARDYEAGARLCEWALAQGAPTAEVLDLSRKYSSALMHQHLYREALATLDVMMEQLPAPDGTDNDYACAMTELWLIKGYCHFDLKEWEPAREAFTKVVEIHPWSDSQNVQRAQAWLGFVKNRRRDPYSPF